MNSLVLLAPLFVFALVALLGFAGCGLNSQGTAPVEPAPPPVVPYPDEVLGSNPIAYWRLADDGGSAQALDQIGQPPGDHPGTYQGPVMLEQTPGLLESDTGVPKAQFDGTGTVDIPNAQVFQTESFTVEALVHPDVISGIHVVVRNMSTAGGWALRFAQTDDPTVDGVLQARGNDGTTAVDLPFAVSLGELGTAWHLAMTYDAATGIVVLYKDGLEVAGSDTFPYTPNTQDPLQIGLAFKGAIQEVAVYGEALTKQDIADHYMATQAEA